MGSEIILTKDKELLKTKDYQTVISVVKKMWDADIIQRSKGYCFSISDMVDTLLRQEGINCRVVECQLTVVNKNPPSFFALGYDHSVKNRDVPTHVICITETEIPMVIDLSIGYIRPDIVPYIVERAIQKDQKTIAEITIEDSTWIYTMKDTQYYPKFHQQNIVQRIKTDRKFQKEISWLKFLIGVSLVLVSLNAIRGGFDFYKTYIHSDVSRGTVIERLDQLEQMLLVPLEERQNLQ